jgi:high-affinity nickel permease
LIDITDGVMMLGAYDWAFVKPTRKLCYNMTITLVSVVVALLIGGIEALRLIADKLRLEGTSWARSSPSMITSTISGSSSSVYSSPPRYSLT